VNFRASESPKSLAELLPSFPKCEFMFSVVDNFFGNDLSRVHGKLWLFCFGLQPCG